MLFALIRRQVAYVELDDVPNNDVDCVDDEVLERVAEQADLLTDFDWTTEPDVLVMVDGRSDIQLFTGEEVVH